MSADQKAWLVTLDGMRGEVSHVYYGHPTDRGPTLPKGVVAKRIVEIQPGQEPTLSGAQGKIRPAMLAQATELLREAEELKILLLRAANVGRIHIVPDIHLDAELLVPILEQRRGELLRLLDQLGIDTEGL